MQEGKIDGYEIGGDRATDLLVRLRLVRLGVEETHCVVNGGGGGCGGYAEVSTGLEDVGAGRAA